MSSPSSGEGKKLVFIGDSGVGKTCIISRFIKGIFEENVPWSKLRIKNYRNT